MNRQVKRKCISQNDRGYTKRTMHVNHHRHAGGSIAADIGDVPNRAHKTSNFIARWDNEKTSREKCISQNDRAVPPCSRADVPTY